MNEYVPNANAPTAINETKTIATINGFDRIDLD